MSAWLVIVVTLAVTASAAAQTNFATLASDGAWTWYNDPRAVYHNGLLYFGYVRNGDGRSVLSAFNPLTGATTELWTSELAQSDDHDNPGLLVKQDGRMLAIHARHGTDQFFSYRFAFTASPTSPADWSTEQTIAATGRGVTYANPYQLSVEGGLIYNFMRNQNYNPTVITSADGGTNWSAPQLLIQTGTGSIRPYVKYCSNYTNRIDFLYTDGHPRNVNNSLYHAYYQAGALWKTDGTLLKSFSSIPLLHDSGERGSVIYQYSDSDASDPNVRIPTGRAWCWETAYQNNGQPAAVFTVQRDQVMGANWYDDRIYYYYARWTGTNWQKRFIAHAGRPLYEAEDDYAGGICLDPEDANVVFVSSNAADPFNLSGTTNVLLRANEHYEIWKGTTADGGLSFTWEPVTMNSTVDNLRPYVPRHRGGGTRTVLWFRGTYNTYTSYSCSVVGLFPLPVQQPPAVTIIHPAVTSALLTNLNSQLILSAVATDDGLPGPLEVSWSTASGPANAIFSAVSSLNTTAGFPLPGTYVLRITASDSAATNVDEITVHAAEPASGIDPLQTLWLKLDESAGASAADSSGNGNQGALAGGVVWRPTGGARTGALECDGVAGEVTVSDAASLDNTAAFTLAFWFRANAYPADSGGLVSKRVSAGSQNAYTTYLKTSNKKLYVDIDGSGNRFASARLINLGQWYHVAVVFDGSLPANSRARLWIDGEVDFTAREDSPAIPDYSSPLRLGNTHVGGTNWFPGRLDDVRLYRRALEPAQVAVLAATNFAPAVWSGPVPAATNGVAAVLAGSAADDGQGGPLTTEWSKLSGPGDVIFSNRAAPSTTVTFNQAGSYALRLRAGDSQLDVCDDLAITVAPNPNLYEDWIASTFPGVTDPALVGIAADPDGDGVKNLVEFGLGMIPSVADAMPFGSGQAGLPVGFILNIIGTNYLAMHLQRPVGRLGIVYEAEVSQDFLSWSSAVRQGPAADNGDGTEIVTFRDVVPVNQAPLRLMRLKLTKSF